MANGNILRMENQNAYNSLYSAAMRHTQHSNLAYYDRLDVMQRGSFAYTSLTAKEICELIFDYSRRLPSSLRKCNNEIGKRIQKPLPVLHRAVLFARDQKFSEKARTYLVSIIKILLDRGADPRELDHYGMTPLNLFLIEVHGLTRCEPRLSADCSQVIVNTVEMLLSAGVDPSTGPTHFKPLDLLLPLSPLMNPYVLAIPHKGSPVGFPLVLQLVDLLEKHGAQGASVKYNEGLNPYRHGIFIYGVGEMIRNHAMWKSNSSVDPYYEVMDKFGATFRVMLLSANKLESGAPDLWQTIWPPSDSFVNAFINIAAYSSLPGRSAMLMRCVLSSLPVSRMNELIRRITELQKELFELRRSSTVGPCSTTVSHALEWLSVAAGEPFSLQHLARLQILGSLSSSAQIGVPSLGLPPQMEKYLLFED